MPRAGIRDFPFTVNLSFEAVNNTSHPLDILKIVTTIGMWAYEWEVFTIDTNITLAPQRDSPTKRYPFYVPTQSIAKEGIEKSTFLTINGEITFKNCLGKTQTDYFGGFYRCEGRTFQYLKALGWSQTAPRNTSIPTQTRAPARGLGPLAMEWISTPGRGTFLATRSTRA